MLNNRNLLHYFFVRVIQIRFIGGYCLTPRASKEPYCPSESLTTIAFFAEGADFDTRTATDVTFHSEDLLNLNS